MTDYTELRRVAKAARDELGDSWLDAEYLDHHHDIPPAAAAFIAATAPATVIKLVMALESDDRAIARYITLVNALAEITGDLRDRAKAAEDRVRELESALGIPSLGLINQRNAARQRELVAEAENKRLREALAVFAEKAEVKK